MRIIRTLFLVATCVVLLPTATPVQAASCKGASHQMTLAGGAASPATGTTATTIRFSAVYEDNAGCDPVSITVTISGVGTFPLTEAGAGPSGGTTYARSMTLPVGVRTYFFSATSGEGNGEVTVQLTTVSPSSVRITAPPPPPTPVPTPKPTPPPTPPPTPVPTPKPPPPATPPPPTAQPAAPDPPDTPAPSPTDAAASPEPRGTDAPGSGTAEPSAESSATPEPSETDAAPAVPGAGPLDPDRGTASRGLAPDWLLPWMLLGVVSGGLFFVLARRRRHTDEDPTLVTVTAGSSAVADAPIPLVTPLPPMRELIPPVDPDLLREADDAPGPRQDEADIPRWLRPSVRQARFQGSRYTRNDNWD